MERIEPTHFNCLYNVPCINVGTGVRRIDYCSSGIREIKYLEQFLKCVRGEAVAVFKIEFKKKSHV